MDMPCFPARVWAAMNGNAAAPAVRNDALARRAEELAAQGAAFATATVVRAQRPTSAHAGDVALITSDGNIEGFVGGICAEHSVRLFAWTAMKSGEPILLRILPTEEEVAGKQGANEDGAVTVLNSCLSGGAIEIFLEPTLPTPRVNIVGSKPIAAAIEQLGPQFDLDIAAVGDNAAEIHEGDLAIIVAAHGKGELEAIRAGLEAELPYVGLVASPKRGAALIEELREGGVSDEHARPRRRPGRPGHQGQDAARGRAVDHRAAHRDAPRRAATPRRCARRAPSPPRPSRSIRSAA